MTAILYTDLNCPFCYATEERIAALGLEHAVEWRGVEHEPDLPVPMDTRDEEIAAELADEVTSVSGRAPEVPIALPPGKPNTARALLAAASSTRAATDGGRGFRLDVYRAYWRDGADISDPAVLGEIARRHDGASADVDPADRRRVAEWQLGWERAPLRGVPLLVRADGQTLYGLKDSAEIADFLAPAP
jgi:predicted DsbA family dithiol-disulfide isomerase